MQPVYVIAPGSMSSYIVRWTALSLPECRGSPGTNRGETGKLLQRRVEGGLLTLEGVVATK